MLKDLLEREKATILKRWFHHVLDSYPADTARFLKREKDPFANPVGSTIQQGIAAIFNDLLGDELPETVSDDLDHILRIRSVQEFSPSEALAFLFALKQVVRSVLKKEMKEKRLREEVERFESRIDRLALLAFDTYVRCREQVYELRVKEVKGHRDAAVRMLDRTNRLIEKMGQQAENPPGS